MNPITTLLVALENAIAAEIQPDDIQHAKQIARLRDEMRSLRFKIHLFLGAQTK